MTIYAEFVAEREAVVCGDVDLSGHRCRAEIGHVREIQTGTDLVANPENVTTHRYLALAVDWRDDGDCYARHGVERERRGDSPVRRGHERTLGGRWISALKSFAFDKPYRCPHCHALNTLDPERLGIEEVPLDTPAPSV